MTDRPIPITRHLSLIYRYSQRYFSARLRGFPLETGQFPLLLQLFRHPEVTQEQLSQRLALDKATTARAAAQLLKSGLIQRREDPDDRRAYRLSPTGRALELEEDLFSIAGDLQEILFEGMTPAERGQAAALVVRMAQNLSAYLERKRPGPAQSEERIPL